MADLLGAPDSDIRRLGNWSRAAMEGCYLTTLPRGAMRALAGFNPQGGMFYLERASINPPEELKKTDISRSRRMHSKKWNWGWNGAKYGSRCLFKAFKGTSEYHSSRCCMFEEEIPQKSSI
jgi:hypothetical protein